MNYFDFIPPECTSFIITHLDNKSLKSFISKFNIVNKLDWGRIFFYYFGKYKNIGYDEYVKYISIDELINKLNLFSSQNNKSLINVDSFLKYTVLDLEVGCLSELAG